MLTQILKLVNVFLISRIESNLDYQNDKVSGFVLSVWVLGVTGVRACIKNNTESILYSAITMKIIWAVSTHSVWTHNYTDRPPPLPRACRTSLDLRPHLF